MDATAVGNTDDQRAAPTAVAAVVDLCRLGHDLVEGGVDEVGELDLGDRFAAGSGGPDTYRGRSMAEAHRGMQIDAAEYDAACDDILGTMEALNYDPRTRGEVGDILQSLKSEIIHM